MPEQSGGWGSGGGYGHPGSGYPAFGQTQSGPAGGPGTDVVQPQFGGQPQQQPQNR